MSERHESGGSATLVEVGEGAGALVLESGGDFAGVEVEVEPVASPGRRTHVALLRRSTLVGEVVAAVFPSLEAGDYRVIGGDGGVASVVTIRSGQVTRARFHG
ncbi:MAG: hypothetical protein ACRDZ6_07880 [Acidimicrobiales bacterium]